MAKTEFRFRNIDKALKGTNRKAQRAVTFAAKQYAKELKERIQQEIESHDAVASGKMRDGIKIDVRQLATKVTYRIMNKVGYMDYVTKGTKPHRPPIKPLQRYIQKKNGQGGIEGLRHAYALREVIAKKGTRPKPFMRLLLTQERLRQKQIIDRYIRMYYRTRK